MQQPSARLRYLLDKYLDQTCTTEELEEFYWLISRAEEADRVSAVIMELWDREDMPHQKERTGDGLLFRSVLERANAWEVAHDAEEQEGVYRRKRMRVRSLAAAAAIGAVMVTVGIRLMNEKNEADSASTVRVAGKYIQPGGNKATLTLANGQVIVVDTARNGMLAVEGSTHILKGSDGKISYETGLSAEPVGNNIITTPRGGQFQIVLPDGTKVWMNAASSIQFPAAFTGKDRRINLSGEAYFEVAQKATQPFYISTGRLNVQVLGTSINVAAYQDEPVSDVTLLEGAVAVEKGGKGGGRVVLIPGQQAAVSTAGDDISVRSVETEPAIAWKNGLISFNGELSYIMRQIARWYDVEVAYKGNVERKSFNVSVSRSRNLSEVLSMLELTKSVRFRVDGRRVIAEPY